MSIVRNCNDHFMMISLNFQTLHGTVDGKQSLFAVLSPNLNGDTKSFLLILEMANISVKWQEKDRRKPPFQIANRSVDHEVKRWNPSCQLIVANHEAVISRTNSNKVCNNTECVSLYHIHIHYPRSWRQITLFFPTEV